MHKAKETNLANRIRTFQRSDKANKQCADCGELGPVYICTDFHTFVCTECSGLHRELSHKVKSITMSNWTLEEVEALEKSGGNVHDREFYMASHDPNVYPVPSTTNREKLREFIRMKYVDKKWVATAGSTQKPVNPTSLEKESPRSIKSNSPCSETKNEKKEKRQVQKEVGWSDDLVSFAPSSQSAVTKPSDPSAEIESHFSKAIELLGHLRISNPVLSHQIATTVIESMQQFVSPSRPVSPAGHSQGTIGAPAYIQSPPQSSNPFDFLPPPSSTAMIHPTVVVGIPLAPQQQTPPSTNPFDIFQ